MSDSVDEWANDIHQGDVLETLAEMPESSVHSVVTSPPYYGLRDYNVDGQIGLEESLGEYIETLVDVGEALRRVLRDDGNWWLNLGDTFAGGGGAAGKPDDWDDLHDDSNYPENPPARDSELGAKQKMLVPHRVAIALQDAGWWVRDDVVWAKPNGMPSSVKDRFTEKKEFIFHLTPAPDYWFDLDAVREPHADQSIERAHRKDNRHEYSVRQSVANEETLNPNQFVHPNGKNPGDWWEIPVKPFPEAHFAVYPEELVERPIKATVPPTVCVRCGTPYARDVDRTPGEYDYTDRVEEMGEFGRYQASGTVKELPEAEFNGWEQTCDCATDETEAGIVLDPFAGAGTTCLVAKRLGRRFIGIDLNPEYVALAQKRVGVTVDEPERLLDEGETSLTAYGGGDE